MRVSLSFNKTEEGRKKKVALLFSFHGNALNYSFLLNEWNGWMTDFFFPPILWHNNEFRAFLPFDELPWRKFIVFFFLFLFFQMFSPSKSHRAFDAVNEASKWAPSSFLYFIFFPSHFNRLFSIWKERKVQEEKEWLCGFRFLLSSSIFDPTSVFLFLRNQTLDGSVIQRHIAKGQMYTHTQTRSEGLLVEDPLSTREQLPVRFSSPWPTNGRPFVLLVSIPFCWCSSSLCYPDERDRAVAVCCRVHWFIFIFCFPHWLPNFREKNTLKHWISRVDLIDDHNYQFEFWFCRVSNFFCSSVAVGFVRFRRVFLSLSIFRVLVFVQRNKTALSCGINECSLPFIS